MAIPVHPELLKTLEDFATHHLWGQVQLDFQRGKLVVIRRTETLKTYEEDNNYEQRNSR